MCPNAKEDDQIRPSTPFEKPAMPVAIDTTFSGLPAIQKIATIHIVRESSGESRLRYFALGITSGRCCEPCPAKGTCRWLQVFLGGLFGH